jgi:uncharacterized membrane protein
MKTPESERLRRQAAATAASCASLSAVTVVAFRLGPYWIGFVCLGLQVVLLVLAMSLLAKSRQLTAGKD